MNRRECIIWQLNIEHNQFSNEIYKCMKNERLQFQLGSSLMGQNVSIYTNYPTQGHSFQREKFRKLEWQYKTGADELSKFAELTLTLAGSFKYYYTAVPVDTKESEERTIGSGFVHCVPDLFVGKGVHENLVPLDALKCCTYLVKLLGPFSDWRQRLTVLKDTGYNMLHLTPVQELGESKSSYSIRDYLQLNTALVNKDGDRLSYAELGAELEYYRSEWGILSVGDVVLNHVAKDSNLIQCHPESTFNLVNSVHLRPAFIFDRMLVRLGADVAAGVYTDRGLPPLIQTPQHVQAMAKILRDDLLPKAALHEFYQCDIEQLVAQFTNAIKDASTIKLCGTGEPMQLKPTSYARHSHTVDMNYALLMYCVNTDHATDKARCIAEFRHRLSDLNLSAVRETLEHTCRAVDALCGHVTYHRLDAHGPKHTNIDHKHELFTSYFKYPFECVKGTMSEDEQLMVDDDRAAHVQAFNGWVMGDDPLRNFAHSHSMVYFRRELICWGDCVKLRYGDGVHDSPYLWQHMTEYMESCAKVFHGLRLDNCHSTPIHVAEYLLDAARRVRPELFVVAELFTGSEQLDNLFVNRLGITSLIREAQQAWDAHELGRLVYKYGGVPMGAFMQRSVRTMQPCTAHALFADMTHDNPAPVTKRTAEDCAATAALVSMASCAVGSNAGYDQLVPFHIDVVTEDRLYPMLHSGKGTRTPGHVTLDDGSLQAKAVINALHEQMAVQGYEQVYVDDRSAHTVCVSRHNAQSHNTVICIARTVFNENCKHEHDNSQPITVQGEISSVAYRCLPVYTGVKNVQSDEYLTGLCNIAFQVTSHTKLSDCVDTVQVEYDGSMSTVHMKHWPPGAVIAMHVQLPMSVSLAVNELRERMIELGLTMRKLDGTPFKGSKSNILADLCQQLTLSDLNHILFKCSEEELPLGAYDIPSFGALPYCGLQGIVPLISNIREKNDLGHPLCANIRAGDWYVDYLVGRLQARPGTNKIGEYLASVFAPYRQISDYLKPSYFDSIVCACYDTFCQAVYNKMGRFVSEGSSFVRSLALATVAFCAECPSANLPELVDPAHPVHKVISLSAGLPHFSNGIFRNWGRDTFIALPGCLLLTERFDDAKNTILAYAASLRHGLIPNLLGSGVAARYNCRDAVWFWLYAIKLYVQSAPDGKAILLQPVKRIYAHDNAQPYESELIEPLHATMFDALNRHYGGIHYTERNAGHQIDEHMTEQGFNIDVRVCRDTGFVFGGNLHNCGTWMDKMGSSQQAGNKGKPATPRDGAAVELQGLCYSVTQWLADLHLQGHWPYEAVKHDSDSWTWAEWSGKIHANFERCFFVPGEGTALDERANANAHLVNKRNIVKDTYGSAQPFADYQLRPNACITLTVAPELLKPANAWLALCQVQSHLQGPLGMRTLDPADWAYDGDYHNVDSNNMKTACGWNYHQGPEWLWQTGFYLRALLIGAQRIELTGADMHKLKATVQQSLACHFTELSQSEWRSLPELTNKDGSFCDASCRAQAWSVACILEACKQLNDN